MSLLNPHRNDRVVRDLRRDEAAAYIREKYNIPCSRQYLAKLATLGGGPPYRLAGRFPLYNPPLLDVWVQARIGPLQSSTSDTAENGKTRL